MAPEEGRNVRNKLVTITLAVISMIKILASSKLYRLPKHNLYCTLAVLSVPLRVVALEGK